MSVFLTYKNRFNEVKAYEVDVISTNDKHTLIYDLEGDKFKTFVTDNILSEHLDLSAAIAAAESEQKNFTIIPRNKSGKTYANREGKIEVCFTGFKKANKAELIELAKQANYYVRSGVVGTLDILVCGDNAGPAKLKKAHNQNVGIVSGKEGFMRFIKTGEVAE